MLTSTIAAISTPAGKGGIGIIRISGDEAMPIASRVFTPRGKRDLSRMEGYTACLGNAHTLDGEILDQVILLCFRAPKSYTGEDVVELQCHGGEAVTEAVLREVLDAGAEPAGKGEFTRRAFLNGRISLTEAEAVMDIINAVSVDGERAAASLAEGSLARKTEELKQDLLDIQTQIAAEIDFPEEDVEEADPEQLKADLKAVQRELDSLLKGYDSGQKMLRGVPAAIIGSPNVGKSTLLNLVAGFDKAIVSSEAGTTRDILEERVTIGGVTLLLADTAGIREEASGEIEQIGISRAKKRLENSNLILAVFDQGRPLSDDDRALIADLKDKPVLAILNKGDLEEKIEKDEIYKTFSHVTELTAKDPESLKTLSQAVSDFLGTSGFDADAPLLANERQRGCAQRARQAVKDALEGVEMGQTLDVCYALLDEALAALYDLSGENASEEVINAVFDRFCVGK